METAFIIFLSTPSGCSKASNLRPDAAINWAGNLIEKLREGDELEISTTGGEQYTVVVKRTRPVENERRERLTFYIEHWVSEPDRRAAWEMAEGLASRYYDREKLDCPFMITSKGVELELETALPACTC